MNKRSVIPLLAGAGAVIAVLLPLGAHAATSQPSFTPDTARITKAVDNNDLVTIQGSRSQRALAATDTGALSDSKLIHNMNLVLKRSVDKQSRFEAYINQLNSPGSPVYHQWLTATQIGTMFGPAQSDIDKITKWLSSQGLVVDSVMPSGTIIRFSGTAAAVSHAFHTQMHSFKTNDGESHFANVTDQQIPAALAPVVKGIASLDNFFPKPQYHNVGVVTKDKQSGKWEQVSTSPDFTVPPRGVGTQTTYDVVPADFNKIYNVEPLWSRSTPIRGAGQTVAVLERTDVQPADINTFRSDFLPANAAGVVSYVNPVMINSLFFFEDGSCPDPGRNSDEGEAALDAEWIGAAAPDANVVVASCDDSDSPTFGPFTAALNLLSNYLDPSDPPPSVFSLSYGECELISQVDSSVSEISEVYTWAAAEGVTMYVSSGDSGSAACDPDKRAAQYGATVNGLASTPWNVAVGGTDFDDVGNTARYWTSTNLPYGLSAVSYIPEQTWNDSCASSKLDALLELSDGVTACNTPAGQQYLNTIAGSGGSSVVWSKPDWQVGIYGAPMTATRMLPDISLFAANGLYGHALVFCMSDSTEGGDACDYSNPDNVYYNSAGGTSFAAPAMAGVQALINQAAGQSHGLIAPALYSLAATEYGTNMSPNVASLNACNSSNGAAIGSACVFNNVTQGDNDVPCYAGAGDCYSGSPSNGYGVVSQGGDVTLAPAWPTNGGYNRATGLGTINAANLVDAMVAYDQRQRTSVAPGNFLYTYNPAFTHYSDIALVDPVKGLFTQIAMKGSIAMRTTTASVAKGYTALIGNFNPDSGSAIGGGGGLPEPFILAAHVEASVAWTGPDHQLYEWLSYGDGVHYVPHEVGAPYPAGWTLVGAGDFDGVGQDELLWRNESTGQIGWWKITTSIRLYRGAVQYFWIPPVTSPLITAAPGYVPTVADVNGDGYADIVWTNPNNNSVYVWINNQAGGFVAHQIADHPAGFTLYGAGDIDGNGRTDLIWTNPTTHQMAWWIMNGFEVVDQEVRDVAPGYTMSSIADYNGDGLADILWVGTAGDVYEWQGTGNGFQSLRVTDATGAPIVIPAGAQVQPIRLQGTAASGGIPAQQ